MFGFSFLFASDTHNLDSRPPFLQQTAFLVCLILRGRESVIDPVASKLNLFDLSAS